MIAVLVALAIVAVSTGIVHIPVSHVFAGIRGDADATTVTIVRNLRLPRVLLGILVGAGLGMSGGALQGALRNSLAEPYLLGVSGGAAVGAVIAFALGASQPGLIAVA